MGRASDTVGAAVAEARREAERSGALARLAVLLVVGALLGAIVAGSGGFNAFLASAFALNVALSAAAVVLTGRSVFRPWMPWLLTTLDAVLALGILGVGPLPSLLPGAYVPALTFSWALFLLLALAALRADGPGLVLYATALLAGGLALVAFSDPLPPGTDAVAALGPALSQVFDDRDNVLRVALLALAGLVLSFGALRARRTLRRAVSLARERQNLARHFSRPIADVIARSDVAGLRRGRKQTIGVLFADIRGFTALSEGLDAEEVVRLLRAFRSRAREVVEGHGGVVDKFIGDAVMGVFGTPVPDGREAANTLAAALAIRDAVLAWSRERERVGLAPVRIGVGAHFGPVFAGEVGDEERVEFTVIGDAVNVAQRIEEATKAAGVSLLASRDLLAAAGVRRDDPAWTALPPGPVRGRSGRVELCRLARDASRPAAPPA